MLLLLGLVCSSSMLRMETKMRESVNFIKYLTGELQFRMHNIFPLSPLTEPVALPKVMSRLLQFGASSRTILEYS